MTEIDRLSNITVVLKDGQSLTREFVVADESELAVVDLSDQTIPGELARTIRDLASIDPASFLGLPHGRILSREKVRVERGGIFLQDRRVTDLSQIFAIIPRDAVREITGPVVAPGSMANVIGGVWLGAALGAGVSEGFGGGGAGFIAGIALGAWVGTRTGSHHTEGLVYRAQ